MKFTLTAVLVTLFIAGCDRNNPVESSSVPADVEFSELSMYKTTVATTDQEMTQLRESNMFHDSLRHGKMLGTLKRYVGLSEAQMESVKVYAKTLFDALHNIRRQVHDSTITKEQARALVVAARDQFIASVKTILTEEQVAKFDEWIVKFWNKRHQHGHRGRGGHGGNGGNGGNGNMHP